MIVGRVIALSNFIYALYTVSMLCFFIYWLVYDDAFFFNYEALTMIIIPTIFITEPLTQFEKRIGNCTLSRINGTALKLLVVLLLAIGIYSVIFFGINLGRLFTTDVVSLRDSKAAFYEGGTLMSKVACMGAYFSPVCLFLYFWNYCTHQFSSRISFSLIVASLAFVVYTMNVAGRDGIVLWLCVYCGFYAFFHSFMDAKQRKKSINILAILSICMLPFFVIISLSRFGDSDSGTIGSILSYIGQGLNTLSTNIQIFNSSGVRPGDASFQFELLSKIGAIFTGDNITRLNRFDNIYNLFDYGYLSNSFGFYIGSIYPMSLSLLQTFLFVFIIRVVCKKNLIINGNIICSRNLISALTWYVILIMGVFYFYYGTYIGNVYLLSVIIIPLFLKIRL